MPILNNLTIQDKSGLYREFQLDGTGKLVPSTTTTHIMDFTGVKDVSNYIMYRAYYGNTALSGQIDMSDLVAVTGNNGCNTMFYGCTGLTGVNISSLATITGGNGCYGMFQGCFNITTMNLSALTTITATGACNSMLSGCTRLESVTFGGLKASTFSGETNQFQYLFSATTGAQAPNGCTVHFPSNFDPSDPDHTFDASTLAGYPTFGGSASYIHLAFDLPATES